MRFFFDIVLFAGKMDNLIYFLKRTIGQKVIVALTGLGLCFFVLIHMLGNLLILSGPEAYNGYAHGLHQFFLFEILEIGLLVFFAGHIVLAILVNIKNLSSRPQKYKVQPKGEKKTSLSDRVLALQGVILLVFLISHLLTFKFGPYYETLLEGEPVRDIHRLVREIFQNPLYVLGYSVVLLVLCYHLIHGLAASVKSLGFSHPKYTPWVERFSLVFGLGVFLGFLIQPLYVYFVL